MITAFFYQSDNDFLLRQAQAVAKKHATCDVSQFQDKKKKKIESTYEWYYKRAPTRTPSLVQIVIHGRAKKKNKVFLGVSMAMQAGKDLSYDNGQDDRIERARLSADDTKTVEENLSRVSDTWKGI